jgi:hypothetical protein
MRRVLALALALAGAACNVPIVHFTGGDGGGGDGSGDGASLPPGSYVWLRSLSQVATQRIAAGASGIVTPGYLYSSADLGQGLMTSAGSSDLVIASFTESDATNLYAVRHGNVGSEFGLLGTIASNGFPIISGVDSGGTTVDLGQGPVTGGAGTDGYIGCYTNGNATWVQRIVGPGEDKILASAPSAGSKVYGGGWFEQTTSFNGGTMTSAGGRDLFVARFAIFGGAVDLLKQYGGTGRDEISGGGMASADGMSFVASGFFDDTITFGPTVAVTASQGGLDMWVAKFDANGNATWAVTFGGPGDDRDNSVRMDSAGDIYMTGTFTTSITFGTIPLTAVGGSDHFLVKLKGSDGSVVWATSFGSASNENAGAIAVDNNGHVAFAGSVAGAFEGNPTNGGYDAIIAEFSSTDGSRRWLHLYSTAGDDGGGGVVYGVATGDLFAVVNLGGAYDFGMPVIGDPNPIGVLMRIAP